MKAVGDEVCNAYHEYFGIPPDKHQSTPPDLTEVDGPKQTTVEMQPFCSGEDLPQISPARTDPSENLRQVPSIKIED